MSSPEPTPSAVTEVDLRDAGLVRSEISLRVGRSHLQLLTAHDLFSGHAIDPGTSLLLRSLRKLDDRPIASVLDVGAGYGPLGLFGALRWPGAAVHLTDRDALAVAFSALNAARNDLAVTASGGLLADGAVPAASGLVLCNIPGKAGEPAIRLLLAQMLRATVAGGLVGVVVVAPLADAVDAELVRLGAEVVDRHRNQTYSITLATPGEAVEAVAPDSLAAVAPDSLAAGVYERETTTVALGGSTPPLRLRTVRGLPEFDTPAFQTRLAWKLARPLLAGADQVLVVNPGQGIVPLAVHTTDPSVGLHLLGRDLLALRVAHRAVAAAGGTCALAHEVPALAEPPVGLDLAVITTGRRDVPAEHARLVRRLGEAGTERVVLAGKAKLVNQVAKRVAGSGWTVAERALKIDAAGLLLTRRP